MSAREKATPVDGKDVHTSGSGGIEGASRRCGIIVGELGRVAQHHPPHGDALRRLACDRGS